MSSYPKILIITIFLCGLLDKSCSTTSNILMLLPFGSTSHMNLFLPIAEALGNRNHNVTLFTLYKPQKNFRNVHELAYEQVVDIYSEMTQLMKRSGKDGFTFDILEKMNKWQEKACNLVFDVSLIRQWIQEKKKFDVLFIDSVMNECFFSIADMLSDSVIILNSAMLFPWIAEAVDVPYPLSYLPNIMLPVTDRMTFWQRTLNLVTSLFFEVVTYVMTEPNLTNIVRNSFPQAKSMTDAMKQARMIFVNADPVFSYSKPNTPAVVEIGGIHCRPPNPLPKDLLAIVEESGTDGFIIFSLGSIHDGKMADEDMQKFISVFERIQQTVIWKFEGDVNVSTNVKLVKWLPQQDLLGHPNARGFITHCGLLSMQEAIYHGVPMVGLPAFVDQPGNAIRGEALNVMVALDWNNLTEDIIYEAIIRITIDESIKVATQRCSALFKDRPTTPIEEAVYWTEYVIRHNPPNHLRGALTNISYIHYFSIDILAIIVSLSCMSIAMSYYCIKKLM